MHGKFNPTTKTFSSPLTFRGDLYRMFSTGFGKPISETSIGVPAETFEGEQRVALSPEAVKRLKKDGFNINIQKGAGAKAGFLDEFYEKEGATIVDNAFKSDIVFKVRPPLKSEFSKLEKDSGLISYLQPRTSTELIDELKAKNVSCFAMNEIPRLSRSQTYDALSSMANISGYKAVIEAANLFDRAFMGQITAAGRLPPAKVLIIGAGVAGLSAIASAKNLGAVVKCFDTRPATKE
jgi:NAD(P) transhydrogenase